MPRCTVALLVAAFGVGCAGARSGGGAPTPERVVAACGPVGAELAAGATLAGMEGDYTVVLVAEEGVDLAVWTGGVLSLRTMPDELSDLGGATVPMYGWTDLVLDPVGAFEAGELGSTSAEAPGVLVLETARGSSARVLLRLGADANRRDVQRFDGAFTVLEVHRIDADAFAGSWRSGAMNREDVEGFFCAERR